MHSRPHCARGERGRADERGRGREGRRARGAADLPEGGVAHVVEAVHGVGAGAVAQLVLGRVVHDAAQELARVVGDGGEEEEHADAEPPADPHRVGEAQEPDAHEAVGAVENRLRQGGQVEIFFVQCYERMLGAMGAK